MPTANKEIHHFFHCALCMAERPPDKSPREWARLEVGWTKTGVQVWCIRHECNVANIDLLGAKVSVNDRRNMREGETRPH